MMRTPEEKKEAHREVARKWAREHAEQVHEYGRNYAKAHPEKGRISAQKWRDTHREESRERNREYARTHREKQRESTHKSSQRLKAAVFVAYGGAVCACCGETDIRFLTIDHVDGGGMQHRKVVGKGNFYRWLRDNNYPEGFQVLCFNCNCGRSVNGGICPHKDPQ